MSPVTLAGALVQQNAEALAVIALAQMTNPGTPVMYGGFTSNVDMRTGAPAFGTPEYARAVIAGGQLARRYGLPYRSSNVNASNAVDAQAAYESEMSLWAALLGGANLVHHAAGWLEGGLCASFEKLVLDAEMLQMAGELLRPVVIDEDELALAAHAEVGTRRPLLRRRPHAGPLRDRLLPPAAVRLAQPRGLARGRRAGRDPPGQRDLEGAAGRLHAAAARARPARGARGLRRAAQGGDRAGRLVSGRR